MRSNPFMPQMIVVFVAVVLLHDEFLKLAHSKNCARDEMGQSFKCGIYPAPAAPSPPSRAFHARTTLTRPLT